MTGGDPASRRARRVPQVQPMKFKTKDLGDAFLLVVVARDEQAQQIADFEVAFHRMT